jgi:hypothetical protein
MKPLFFLLFMFFNGTVLFAQQLKLQHSLLADTLRANAIVRSGGSANQLLLANGEVAGTSTGNLVLVSQANHAAPVWTSLNNQGQGLAYSLLSLDSLSPSNKIALGINTSSPNALLSIDGSGYAVNKVLYLNSNGSVGNHLAYRVNSVSSTGNAGLKFLRDSILYAYMGLEGNKNLVINTYRNANVGINTSNPRASLDVNGTLSATGLVAYQPHGRVTGNVDFVYPHNFIYRNAINVDYITVEFDQAVNGGFGYVLMPYLAGTQGAFAGKRICIQFRRQTNNSTFISFNTNELKRNNGNTQTSLFPSIYKSITFVSDGQYWYIESYLSR